MATIDFIHRSRDAKITPEAHLKKYLIAIAASALLVAAAHAYDAAYEAALVIFYDKTCTKLPADFVKAKAKETASNRHWAPERIAFWNNQMKEAQDGVRAEYERDPTQFCANEQRNIKCMLDYYRTKKSKAC